MSAKPTCAGCAAKLDDLERADRQKRAEALAAVARLQESARENDRSQSTHPDRHVDTDYDADLIRKALEDAR